LIFFFEVKILDDQDIEEKKNQEEKQEKLLMLNIWRGECWCWTYKLL